MTVTNRRQFLKQSGRSAVTAAAVGILGGTVSHSKDQPPKIRLGIIGLDTSHVSEFTKHFNRHEGKAAELADIQVVAAFPAGNPNFPLSRDRVAGFTKDVREMGVDIVGSIEELLPRVDGVLLQSVDGGQHLEQVRPVFAAGKPLFIDKPLAASLKDALEIAELGRKHQVPWFTASSSRFTAGYPELRKNENIGGILGCDVYSQSRAAPGHPDLFWYGVHGVDLLYSLIGPGCESVTAVQTQYSEHVTGTWNDGRIGTYRAIREHTGKTGVGVTVFGTNGIQHVNNYYDYFPLVVAIAEFFRKVKSPVPEAEMLEVITYMAAAEESKRRNGVPVRLDEVTAGAKGRT
jgi:predicted dehydrogenase